MDTKKISAMTRLNDITECCICLKTFTDPRMLPCIHTFCFQCLESMVDKLNKKPKHALPCPVCRKEFTIPDYGVQGMQKNFFMAGMIEVKNALTQSKMSTLPCDVCKENNDAIGAAIQQATMRCLSCQKNLCEGCCKMHESFKASKSHEILKIGNDVGEEETINTLNATNCDIHRGKVLDYYCAECKKVVCVSCFVEGHKTHDCKDVNSVEENFRKIIKCNASKISALTRELLANRNNSESREKFLKKMAAREKEILQRSEELKEMINMHTICLLSSLDEIKNRHLKEIKIKEDEFERRLTILESFSRYCDELRSKGSASDVCRSKDELLRRADELEEDHENYIMRPRVSFDVTFQATEIDNLNKTTDRNIIGRLSEQGEHLEDFAVVIGSPNSYKINLHRQSDTVCPIENVPTTLKTIPAAAVYNNTMFITGIGKDIREIWKYSFASGWKICGSLVKGREFHCAEFIGETLYICGGVKGDIVMDSIEGYNVLNEKSTIVGRLRFGSKCAACFGYQGSVYVFGGIAKDCKLLDCVQVFSPVERNCTLLSTPMPRPCAGLRAVFWKIYAILVSCETCFIFDFLSKTWQERKQFKTGATFFELVLQNERVFVIDGPPLKADSRDDSQCKNKDSVKYIRASGIVSNEATKWKTYRQLPKPIVVFASAKLSLVK